MGGVMKERRVGFWRGRGRGGGGGGGGWCGGW